MKRIALVLSAGIFLISCNNQTATTDGPKNTDLIAQNLKGKVKQVEEAPYKVDSSGKVGEMDTCCIYVNVFDEKGYNSSSVTKNSKGDVKSETTITHYDGGQAKEYVSTANGKTQFRFVTVLDKDGKYTGGQSYDSSGKMDSYYTDLKENDYGAVTDGIQHKPDSSVKASFHSIYDKATFMSGSSKDSSGKVVNSSSVKLNDKGDPIEVTSMNVSKDSTTNTVTTYTYDSYDDQGNWTQRTNIEKGKPKTVTKRTITYYKKD